MDNIQNKFLEKLKKDKVPVSIFLTNGNKLMGQVTAFDNYTFYLVRDGVTQLVYKHSVSTILPASPIYEVDGNR